MQSTMRLLLGAVLLIGIIDVTSSCNVWQLAAVNGNFAFNLYNRVSEMAGEQNVFFSPVSISMALSMTYAGARGQTLCEMCRVLGYCQMRFKLHSTFGVTLSSLTDGNERFTITLANRLFAQDWFEINHMYTKITAKYYGAALKQVDFHGDPNGAADIINNWVAKQTKNKIQNLVFPKMVQDAALVLVNAIYFKALWKHPFDPQMSGRALFFVSATERVQVDMMQQSGVFRHSQYNRLDCQILELPYEGDRLAMYILLPKYSETLSALESRLTFMSITYDLAMLRLEEVDVRLPKFEMTLVISLTEILKKMGMKQPFDKNDANFSGISPDQLFLSQAVHKAFISVGEKGTEAAAATGIIGESTGILQNTRFYANRPFLFLIRDIKTGSILFLGRIMKP